MMWYGGWGMGWFGWFIMVAWWALVLAGIVWLVRNATSHSDGAGTSNARRILDERFASGELTADEYEERRRVLR